MLVELGARWVIVGHSERRQYFGETDATAAAGPGPRSAPASRSSSVSARRSSSARPARRSRCSSGRAPSSPVSIPRLAVAYEPVWAIGTGRTATPAQAQEAHAFLRGPRRAPRPTPAGGLRILYGGSVKPDNAAEMLAQEDVDGALVGGASLDAETFSAIIRCAPALSPGVEESRVYTLLIILYVLVCIFLILVVLLQQGKGADVAAAFGGASSQTAFGPRGTTTLMHKLTTGSFVVFVLLCIGLSVLTARQSRSVTTKLAAPAAARDRAPPTPANRPPRRRRPGDPGAARQRGGIEVTMRLRAEVAELVDAHV